jgi:hypothetical protein
MRENKCLDCCGQWPLQRGVALLLLAVDFFTTIPTRFKVNAAA